jgi:hypothetical protein
LFFYPATSREGKTAGLFLLLAPAGSLLRIEKHGAGSDQSSITDFNRLVFERLLLLYVLRTLKVELIKQLVKNSSPRDACQCN